MKLKFTKIMLNELENVSNINERLLWMHWQGSQSLPDDSMLETFLSDI